MNEKQFTIVYLKNAYCPNARITQNDLRFYATLIKIPTMSFTEKKKSPRINMIPWKPKQCPIRTNWRYHIDFKIYHKAILILTHDTGMKTDIQWNREPRQKSTQLPSVTLTNTVDEERTGSLINTAGKTRNSQAQN